VAVVVVSMESGTLETVAAAAEVQGVHTGEYTERVVVVVVDVMKMLVVLEVMESL
jgi:hypothetical protein